MYSFSFIVGNIIPKSVKCIPSATKVTVRATIRILEGLWVSGCGFRVKGLSCQRLRFRVKGRN